MRLRRRHRRALPPVGDDWVVPAWLDGAEPAVHTPVGNVDSAERGWVDGRGLVSLDGWSLDWWVGADDRWRLPSREVAVRQRLVDDVPVVETAMRVPGGDAVHRVFGARAGAADLLVIEVENRSPAPFAVALAVRPFDRHGRRPVTAIEPGEGVVRVDGRAALLVPRPPSRAAGSTGAAGDVAAVVLGGAAGEHVGPVRDPDGGATAAFLWPVPHRTTIRFAVPLDGTTSLQGALPSVDQVVRGWRLHGSVGARLLLPDARLQSAVDACRRFLLLDGEDAGGAGALALLGDAAESAARLRAAAGGPDGAEQAGAALVEAAGRHWRLYGDRELARDLAPAVAHVADEAARRRPDPAVLHAAADVLTAAGEDRAAGVARRAAERVPPVPAPPVSVQLDELLDTASPTWRWPEASGHRLLALARAALVAERGDGVLSLVDGTDERWLGQPVELHDAPTAVGRLSFAVRWHGERPALLWELEPRPAGDGGADAPVAPAAVRLVAPALDPSWSAVGVRGDALLSPVHPATPVAPPSIGRRPRT